MADVVRALQGNGSYAVKELRGNFHKFLDGETSHTVRIGHGHKPLNTYAPEWWVLAFTDLFFSGDFMARRGLSLRQWARTLVRRADFAGWAACKEFAATAYNICIRRAQMWAVKAYVSSSPVFKRSFSENCLLKPADLLASALAAGECDSIRAALRKSKS